jgi:hypothetical protein
MSAFEPTQHSWVGLALVIVAIVLLATIYVFRRRRFENGPRKGTAADPGQVKRDNPPDRR